MALFAVTLTMLSEIRLSAIDRFHFWTKIPFWESHLISCQDQIDRQL